MEKYLTIYPSGLMCWTELERSPRFDGIYTGECVLSVDDVRKVINCKWIESVHTLIPGVVMIVDEVGKILPVPKSHNELASRLYGGFLPPFLMDDIVGTVMLFALKPCNDMGELDWYPLDPNQLLAIEALIGRDLSPL